LATDRLAQRNCTGITPKTGEPFGKAGIDARDPSEFDTAENPVNVANLTRKAHDAIGHIHIDPDQQYFPYC
jgi:hypothetical protein